MSIYFLYLAYRGFGNEYFWRKMMFSFGTRVKLIKGGPVSTTGPEMTRQGSVLPRNFPRVERYNGASKIPFAIDWHLANFWTAE